MPYLTDAEKFEAEMKSTPELGMMAIVEKRKATEALDMMLHTKDTPDYDRWKRVRKVALARHRELTNILQSRQMRMFYVFKDNQ